MFQLYNATDNNEFSINLENTLLNYLKIIFIALHAYASLRVRPQNSQLPEARYLLLNYLSLPHVNCWSHVHKEIGLYFLIDWVFIRLYL